MTTRKFADHPHANARINYFNDGTISLVSYRTTVLEISPEGWLTVTGLYSMTTIKHIGWFMREVCGLTYQHAKEVYKTGEKFNVYTGEVIGG